MRFRWMPAHQYLTNPGQPHVVVDTEPPDGEPGQAAVFGTFSTKQQAVMTCMTLNGNAPVESES